MAFLLIERINIICFFKTEEFQKELIKQKLVK